MSIIDEDNGTPLPIPVIGEDLSLLSVEELRARISLLREEISRTERELSGKGASKAAAEALFRRS